MKSKKKVLLTICCAVVLVVASVMGTMAYLTSHDAVNNTFTVGDVEITLDEAPVNADGKATEGDRVKANRYKLMPGHEYDKDPTIHVAKDSEACWLFVQVVDEIAAIEANDTVAAQMAANGWALVPGTTNIYAYKETVAGGKDVVVFDNFKILGTVADLANYDEKTITVKAYAVQADGFDTAAAAWTAAPTNFDF